MAPDRSEPVSTVHATAAGPTAVEELPEEIEQHHAFYDYSTRARQTAVEFVPLIMRETERAAPHDLDAVLRLAESGKLAVSARTSRPSAATTRIVAQAATRRRAISRRLRNRPYRRPSPGRC